MRVIGMISGTSMDGITAALVDIEEDPHPSGPPPRISLVAQQTVAYPDDVRRKLLAFPDAGTVEEICGLNFFIGELFARAAHEVATAAGSSMDEVDLIGSHGQTICHLPVGLSDDVSYSVPSTLQIGELDVIAERTGVNTIGDFRPRDMAVGGEGAPLIPYVDHLLFSHADRNRVLLNLGGIANVTYLPAGAPLDAVSAFDTGPANMVMDGLIREITRGERSYDADGERAAQGQVHAELLDWMMEHPFILQEPPKTTGREDFGDAYLAQVRDRAEQLGVGDADQVATATEFTVASIRANCDRFLGPMDELIAAGGGSKNATLMARLAVAFPDVEVSATDELGIPAEAKEAVGFAIMAYQAWHRRPNNAPTATGARKPVVMGKLAWGHNGRDNA